MFEKIIQRGTLMTVIVVIVVVLGIVATLRVPVQMIPDLDVRTVQVRTSWPGATPQDIEKEILIEQEEYLRNIPSLQRIESTASTGDARIELEFPHGVDINETLIRVNNALSQVPSYPANVNQPRIYAEAFSSNSFMYFRVAPRDGNPRGLDMDMMRDFVSDNVRTRMETVPGVSSVEVWGGADRQLQILVDPVALAERGLSVADLREAVRARNRDVTGGKLDAGKRRYLLRTIGRFDDIESLDELILARRDDQVIRLGDVARVRLDHFEVAREAYVNGKPVLFLAVNRELGSNVIEIKDRMLERMDRINAELLYPAGMELRLNATDTVYVEQSIATVWRNLLLGAVLATLVMFLFLRSARMTLVGVMGIPICTIAAFIGLLLAGRTINVISLAGVAFSIGMTLDNTIVVLESIEWERRKGLRRLQAAITGVRRVWPAVLASTMTTVLVFIPIIFIREEAGQLYGDIAIGVSATILISMLVAITVVPTAAANFALHDDGAGAGERKTGAISVRRGLLASVNWLIDTALRRVTVMVVTAGLSAAIILALTPPAEYLPPGEEPKVFGRMNAPPGYNLPTMREIGLQVQAHFLPFLDDDPGEFRRGETEVPALDYLIISIRANGLFLIAEPKDKGQVNALMAAIDAKYSQFPGMRSFTTRGSIITSNSGGTRSINLDISGSELESIYAVAATAYERAHEVFDNPRIQADPPTLSLSQPLIEIHPEWERAAELGMNTAEIGYTVAALTDGAFVDEFFMADNKVDIYLYSSAEADASPQTLAGIPVHTRGGGVLPLSSIARVVETVDTSTVRRIDGRRTVTLSIIPPEKVALETGVEIVREDLLGYLRESGAIPSSVSVDISGAGDQLDATRQALKGNYLVALVLVYLVMVAIFSHWGYPILIMTTIPLGVAGGIAGLALMNFIGALLPEFGLAAIHQPFDMISMLGFLILMGTVVNNPILIVHRAADNYHNGGMDASGAVREAVESRLRPIAMSAITTVFGLAPLVFIPGEGTELYRGVGAIVLFGLVGAALVTLTFLPAITVTVLSWMRRDEIPCDVSDEPQAAAVGDRHTSGGSG